MGVPSGLGAQFGCAEETTYGTGVTTDRFYEFITEAMKQEVTRMESQGLRAGNRILRSDRWGSGRKIAGGSVEFELANKSFGRLFKHMFGTVAISQPAVGTDPTVFDQLYTPGDLPVGLTAQLGKPNHAGTIHPFTYEGCKVAGWEISANVDEFGKLKLDIVAEEEKTATALAVASYPTGLSLVTFVQGSLTVAGSAANVKSFKLAGNNGLMAEEWALGSANRRKPLEAAFREYTGEFDADFEGLTDYNRFINGTEAALVLKFEGATISNAYKFTTEITCNVRFDGDTPTVGGPGQVRLPMKFKCVASGATPDTAIKLNYRTTDTLS